MRESIRTLVIGAGQAGLATSYWLKQAGIDHLLLERRDQLGGAWRERWDSFCLVAPNFTLVLPGTPYAGPDPDAFMPREWSRGVRPTIRPDDRRAGSARHPRDPPAERFSCNPRCSGTDGGHDIDLRPFARKGIHLYGGLDAAGGKTVRFTPDLAERLAFADAWFGKMLGPMFDAYNDAARRPPRAR